MHLINERIGAPMVIADTVYNILWKGLNAGEGFKLLEKKLV